MTSLAWISALIFFGAGFGGVCRYWVSTGMFLLFGRNFPYGTLIVNISGCFLIGLLYAISITKFDTFAPQFRSLILIGLLGGYTTFASFSLETLALIESGALFNAFLNIFLNITLCLTATWIGLLWGRVL